MAMNEPNFVEAVAAALATARGDAWDDLPEKVRADYRSDARAACDAFVNVLAVRLDHQVHPEVLKNTSAICKTVVAWVRGWMAEAAP